MKGLRAALLVLLLAMLSVTETEQRVRAQDTATPVVSPATVDRTAFANPPSDVRPAIRWWWPGGDVTNAELARELSQMQAAGFGSAEIQSFAVGLPAGASGAVPTYGSPEWFDRVGFALDRARELGMTLDLTVGSSWPMAATDIPDSQSLKQLTVTAQFVQGPTVFDAAVPAAVEPLGSPLGSALLQFASTYDSTKMRLLTVLAGKRADNQTQDETGGAPALDDLPNLPPTVYIESGSIITLTPYLTAGGRLQWPVPDGNWMIFALYQGPTGSKPFYDAYSGNARVIDHFNREAVLANVQALADAATSRFGSHVGTTLRSFFIDSLELRTELYWTDDLLDEFATRRGYRLEAFLPVLFRPLAADAYLNKVYPNAPASYDVRVVGRRVRQDYDHTIGALLAERFFEPLQEWSRTSGIDVRVQAHGAPVDLLNAYGAASVPETEGLYAGGNPAFLKIAASAAKAAGRPVVSSEILAFKHGATTPTRILQESNRHLASGVNQLVLHGFPYVYDAGFPHPGWMPFNSPYMPGQHIIGTFGSHLNDRNPIWPHMRHVTDYLARAQLVLRSGTAAADVAVYSGHLGYPDDPASQPEVPTALLAAGYSFDYVNADLLRSATVESATLRVNNNRYKALIIPGGSPMTVAAASRLKQLADSGLRILLVGDMPQEGTGLLDLMNDGDAAVQSHLEAIRAAQAASVADAGGLASALSTAGIRPELRFDGGAPRVSFAHRTVESADYYFLTSDAAAPFDVNVTFPNPHARLPEIFDLHTGKIFPAPIYTNNGLDSTVLLHFEPGTALVVGFDRAGTAIHLETGSSLPGVYRDEDGQLAGLADAPGSFMAVVNGGVSQMVTARGPSLTSIGLPTWDIVAGTRDATGASSTEAFTRSSLFDLSSLGTYSGNARYTAFLDFANLDSAYRRSDVRLLLDLGQLTTVAQVRVNDSPARTLISAPYTIDVTEYLIDGLNKFEVMVATSPGETPAGLLGPVTLVPRYRLLVPGFRPLQTSIVVTPQNFPNSTVEDLFAATDRAGELVNHVNFQWFWKTPPSTTKPEGGAVVECQQVSQWVQHARSRNLTVTLQFQSFYAQLKDSYSGALDTAGGLSDLAPIVRVASPIAPFETASFGDPELADAYLNQIRCLAALNPEYLVLGPEVNFAKVFNPTEWLNFVPVYGKAYELVKTISPITQVGLSFQYDGLRFDRLNGDDGSIVATGPRDFVALTTYFGYSDDRHAQFPDPALIPDDYYHPVREIVGPDIPVIFSEIGWSSFYENGLETQAAFIRRLPNLLAAARPDHITWALEHDVRYFEGAASSLNESGLLTVEGDPKPSWDQAMVFRREGVLVDVVPHVYAPAPLPFSVTASPPHLPASFTEETGFAAIATAAQVAGHVNLQFAWKDFVTKEVWDCDRIRRFTDEAKRLGLRFTIQFNTYQAVAPEVLGAPPRVVFLNPIHPATDVVQDPGYEPSIGMPAIRDAYIQQVACLAELGPDYLVLGPEVNFLVGYRIDEFDSFASAYQAAYAAAKAVAPSTQISVSYQYDAIRQNLLAHDAPWFIPRVGPQDFLGVTSYFAISSASLELYPSVLAIPLDYYDPIRTLIGPDKPVVFTEIGWTSYFPDGTEEQVAFVNRLPRLLQSVKPANVIWALQHDVGQYYLNGYEALNHVGLRQNDGTPKPAWDQALWLRDRGVYITAAPKGP